MPYFLDHSSGGGVETQGVTLVDLPPAQRAARIVADIDRHLVEEAQRRERPRIVVSDNGNAAPADIDIVVVATAPAAYEALARGLGPLSQVVGTRDFPNRNNWVVGVVPNARQGDLRVLLAEPTWKGNDEVRMVSDLVHAFRPEHVMLVCAGELLARRVQVGHVVVAERVYGHGGSAGTMFPRPDLSFPTDPALANAASVLAGSASAPSTVHVGPITAGLAGTRRGRAAFAPVLTTWPDLLATVGDRIAVVEALEELRQRGLFATFSVLCPIAAEAGVTSNHVHGGQSTMASSGAADAVAAVVRRLVADLWPAAARGQL